MWIALVVPPALLLLALLLQRLEEAVFTDPDADLDADPNAGRDVHGPHDGRLTSVQGGGEGPARGSDLVEPEPARHVTRASA